MNFINKARAALAIREKGQAMVEYGLILVLVSVVAVVGLTAVGGQLVTFTTSGTPPTTNLQSGSVSEGAFNKVIDGMKGVTLS